MFQMHAMTNIHYFQVQIEKVKDQGDEELYARLDSAYSSEDEDVEVSAFDYLTPFANWFLKTCNVTPFVFVG
jgi:hypothetical protein